MRNADGTHIDDAREREWHPGQPGALSEDAPSEPAGPLPVVGSGGVVGGPSDTDRLDLLAELMQQCPHAELTYNDDQDEGLVGYGLNVDGCEPISIFNSTLRGVLDQLRKELDRRAD